MWSIGDIGQRPERSKKKQFKHERMTAVEWIKKELECHGSPSGLALDWETLDELIEKAKEIERDQKILLVEQLKDYTKEAQCILGNDEREASEFVDIFYNTNI